MQGQHLHLVALVWLDHLVCVKDFVRLVQVKVRACRSCSVAVVQHLHQHLHHDELWVSESHRLYRRLKVAQHLHLPTKRKRRKRQMCRRPRQPMMKTSLCQLSDRNTDNGLLFVLLVLVVHSIAISARTTECRWRVNTRVYG
jgi:hypothetical protein